MDRRHERKEQGFALISVLWVVILLSLIAMTLLSNTRNAAQTGHTYQTAIDQRAISDAAISFAVLKLVEAGELAQWGPETPALAFEWNGIPVDIRIQDEHGKFDLNTGAVDVLATLLSALIVPQDLADDLVSDLEDRRSKEQRRVDTLSQSAFMSVEGLKTLPHMTEALFEKIESHSTVHSGLTHPDRRVSTISQSTESNLSTPHIPLSGGRAFTITVRYPIAGAMQVSRQIIRIASDAPQGYWILSNR